MTTPIEDHEFLYLIFDVNPLGWAKNAADNDKSAQFKQRMNTKRGANTPLNNVMEDICAFANSFLALHRSNRLCLQTVTHASVETIWPVNDQSHFEEFPFQKITDRMISGVKQQLDRDVQANVSREGSLITGAFCKALCMINRNQKELPNQHYRVLIIQNSVDCPMDYVKFMNCVFSAGKQRVVIDGITFAQMKQSIFLQQATYWTNGILFRPSQGAHKDGVIMQLLTQFLPSPILRKHMPTTDKKSVDLKATCFCCQQHKEIAYVCPVCLAIYCKRTRSCPMCGARLPKMIRRDTIL